MNVWSPLVDATPANGCMKFVPYSQQLGILPHKVTGTYSGVTGDGKALDTTSAGSTGAYITTIDPSKMEPLEKDAIDVPLGPGDIVLFSNILVHRGGNNSTETIRWSFDWRFQDASKPTLREHNGHIVYCKPGKEVSAVTGGKHTSLLQSATDWEKAILV